MKISQDKSQRLNVYLTVVLELYRVITCSLLILFVPQNCAGHVCSVSENLSWNSPFYNFTLVFNFITMAGFVPLYFIELRRENRLIKYLDVNPDVANDDESVAMALVKLSPEKKQKILKIDKIYQKIGYCMIILYFLNTVFSGVVVFGFYYLNNQTASAFITYLIYMSTKFSHVYTIANTEENIFYSGYLVDNVQYNDLDKSLKLEFISEEPKDQNTIGS